MNKIHIVSANNKNIVAFSSEEDANDFAEYYEERSGQKVFVNDLAFDPVFWKQFVE